MENLAMKIRAFSNEIIANEDSLDIENFGHGEKLTKENIVMLTSIGVPSIFIDNYKDFFGFLIKWEAKPETGIKANGSIKIMKLPVIFSDWEGQAYVPNTPENSPLRNFKIVDFAYDEYATGIIFDENKDFTFYLIELDGSDPVNLDLDINGYIEMMIYSKGYGLWQRVIEHLLYGKYYKEHTERFKENMPKLFPDWTWEGFVKKFEAVRLNKMQ